MTTESVALRLAAAASGSWLVQVCRRMATSIRARPDLLSEQAVEDDLSALRSLLAGSSLAAPVTKRTRRAVGAVLDSRALRALSAWREPFESLARWQLIRALGIAALSAGLVDALLVLIDPRPVSGVRWFLWSAVVLMAAVLITGARSFAAASGESRALRHL
jgi:hypothetical protein